MKYIFKIALATTNTNLCIEKGRIGKWFYSWNNNLINAYTLSQYDKFDSSEPFNSLEKDNLLNLGLLIDLLTIGANFGVNTDIVISTKPKILVFQPTEKINQLKSIDQAKSLIHSAKCICDASCLNDDSSRVCQNTTITLSNDSLTEIKVLLESLEGVKINKTHMKLLNYWRKGVDLDLAGFPEESYLAFFKIIEYYQKRSTISINDIPSQYHESKTMCGAYRFASGANLTKMTQEQYEMVADFIQIRNNFDIAHSMTNYLPESRYGNLYYSSIDDLWDLHSHICQISRWLVLTQLGIKGLSLVENGGLLSMLIDEAKLKGTDGIAAIAPNSII